MLTATHLPVPAAGGVGLADFLRDLLAAGQVTVAGAPAPLAPDDARAAADLLHGYYLDDQLDLPHAAPAYDAPAALWAAELLYRAVQLAVLRELDEAAIRALLPDFAGPATPETVYAADLCLRYLPDVLHLAKGLAPADALVARLEAAGHQWPLSFVGAALPPTSAEATAESLTPILAHPALRLAYTDRIIAARDRARAAPPAVAALVQQALGDHAAALWPEFAASFLVAGNVAEK